MMMPANFSVMAENELTYIVGGSAVTDWAKQLSTNTVTIVGNSYLGDLVGATLGTMFSGSWGESGFSISDAMSNAFFKNGSEDKNAFNKALAVVGLGAAVYNLGTANVVSTLEDEHKTKHKENNPYYHDGKKLHFFGTDGMIAQGLHTVEKYF